jgi:hypothetical protein
MVDDAVLIHATPTCARRVGGHGDLRMAALTRELTGPAPG